MTAPEYRRLVARIVRVHGKRLNLSKVGAAEFADEVWFGRITEVDLLDWLSEDSTPINR